MFLVEGITLTCSNTLNLDAPMRLEDHFRRLYAALEGKPAQPGMPALASALHCSERNARSILRKMESRGWLRWDAARGRGHFSQLTLLATPQDIEFKQVSELLAQGELEQAFARLGDGQRTRLKARLPEFLRVTREAGDTRERIRAALPRQVGDLDPYNVSAGLEVNLAFHVFSRLIDFDSRTQRLIPALAHHWTSERNGTVWHFWLRPGVHFHDGSELEPEDVRQTLLRLRDTPGSFQALYRHLEFIELGAGRKITCRLKATDYLWPHALASANASIVPRRRKGNFSSMPVGSGPFEIKRHSEYRLTLSAFADYYRERALLDEVDLWVSERSTGDPGFDLYFGVAGEDGNSSDRITQVQSGCSYLVCNPARKSFRNEAQRMAFAGWLAPESVIAKDDLSRRPASGLLPGWNHRGAASGARPPIPPNGTLKLVTQEAGSMMALARMIKERLRTAEIVLEVVAISEGDFLKGDWLKSADLMLCTETLPDDEDFGCYEWFAADKIFRQWMPRARLSVLDRQLQVVREQTSTEARMPQYSAIARQLVCEGWLMPIAHSIRQARIESHVGGVKRLSYGMVSFTDLWLPVDSAHDAEAGG